MKAIVSDKNVCAGCGEKTGNVQYSVTIYRSIHSILVFHIVMMRTKTRCQSTPIFARSAETSSDGRDWTSNERQEEVPMRYV